MSVTKRMSDKTKLTFLGSGTSQGVPIIGCDCPVCTSADERDKRFRASVLIEYKGLTILVDAGPDFRSQMLRAGVKHLDAILLTHNHKDHTGGIDDVRSFNLLEHKPVNIYCQEYVLNSLKREYAYAFSETLYPGAPEIKVNVIGGGVGDEEGAKTFEVHSNRLEDTLVWESGTGYHHVKPVVTAEDLAMKAEIIPIQGWHHEEKVLPVLGYRFGNVAYLTDLKHIDDREIEKLKGLDIVTVNCVKRTPHHSHFSLPQAIDFFRKVGAKRSYLTHISHLLPCHADLEAELQSVDPSFHVAYDGLVLESGE